MNQKGINQTLTRKGKMERLSADSYVGQSLYLAAWTLFLLADFLSTTMFVISENVFLGLKVLALLLVLVKMVFWDKFSARMFWILAVLIGIGALIYLSSGYTDPILWMIMLFGARNVPLRKILQVYLIISVSILLLAFSASMLGVIENLQYSREEGGGIFAARWRNSFGAVYTTDFASHVFSIMLAGYYLLKERLKVWHFGVSAILAILIYYFCNTRVDVVSMVLLILSFAFLNLMKSGRMKTAYFVLARKSRKWVVWVMPVVAALMCTLTVFYNKNRLLLVKLDEWLSNRLEMGKLGLSGYGISLFGQSVEMYGYGGTIYHTRAYFFIDCSYLYVLLCYGLVFFLIVMLAYVLCARRYQKDAYFLVVLILISINCMIAHHLISLSYNPFMLALFAGAEGSAMLGSMQYRFRGRYAGADRWNESALEQKSECIISKGRKDV